MLPSSRRRQSKSRQLSTLLDRSHLAEWSESERPIHLRVDLEVAGSRAVLRPCGEIDFAVAADLLAVATLAVQHPATDVVILDFTDVRFIDSVGCAVVNRIHETCQAHRKNLILSNASARIQRVFELLKIDPQLIPNP
jgi:anti-anti-sigma factor